MCVLKLPYKRMGINYACLFPTLCSAHVDDLKLAIVKSMKTTKMGKLYKCKLLFLSLVSLIYLFYREPTYQLISLT